MLEVVPVEEALAAADAAALGVHQAFADSSDLSGLKGRRGQQLNLLLVLSFSSSSSSSSPPPPTMSSVHAFVYIPWSQVSWTPGGFSARDWNYRVEASNLPLSEGHGKGPPLKKFEPKHKGKLRMSEGQISEINQNLWRFPMCCRQASDLALSLALAGCDESQIFVTWQKAWRMFVPGAFGFFSSVRFFMLYEVVELISCIKWVWYGNVLDFTTKKW